ncbi:MAG: GNAT family N-acetyltransferase [Sphaerobacter sp.]|nr:GNAT family N-acetyltransferase [Sphaerobacter sp.]
MSIDIRGSSGPRPASTSLRVDVIDPGADRRWATFVSSHPAALTFHQPAWLQTLADAFGYAPAHLACEDADGNLQGVLPLFYRRGLLKGRWLWSLPHTPVAGPLANSAEAAAALVRGAIELAAEPPAHKLRLHTMDPALDPDREVLTRTDWYPTFVIELPDRSEPCRLGKQGRKHDLERGIRKAVEYGLSVRDAERHEDLRAWYHFYLWTMREKSSPAYPFRLFDVAWHYLRPEGLLKLLLVERHTARGPELLGGAICLATAQTVLAEYLGRGPDARRVHFQDLLQWHAVNWAREAGFRYVDLGNGSPRQAGLARYKRKWGATERPIYRYYSQNASPSALSILSVQSDSRLVNVGRATWQRVPLAITAYVGNGIFRYL